MKKIFTHLFAVLLLSFVTVSSVWAQETTEIPLNFSDGACNSTSGAYCYSWTSTTDPAITVSVGNNKNNLVVNPSSGNFEMHEGASGSTWTFSVTGYRIVSYSFTYKTKQTGNDVTITIGETTYTSSDSEQSLEIAGLDSPTASFSLSGSNTGVVVSNLKLNVYKHSSLTALEEGQVYMFENARAARSLRANGTSDVHVKATVASDLAQQWYVTKEGEYYVLRNIACGKYLKGALTNGIGWGMTDDYSATENKFELHTSNYETLNTLKTNGSNGYGYMHDDNNGDNGGYNVVGWLNGDTNTGSHWIITKVDYTSDEITALLEKAPTVAESAAYITSLEALFADAACVTPKLGSLAEAQASDAYKALPTGFKAMVDKVYNEKTEGVALETAWAENNANATKAANDLNWSGKYAKKFRVQMYEPYSIAGDITGFLRMNAHSNNDNPTGIYVAEPGTVYVMVEGTIKDGASLRLHRAASNHRITNPTGDGYALTTGLNVINITEVNDGGDHLYICYNVDTYNPDGATVEAKFPHKLSEYSPLKIHIEGGAINGFYNAQGDFRASALGAEDDLWFQISGASYDCDADWVYMEERANLAVLPIVSNRQVMLFQLEDTNGSSGTKTLLPESVTVPTVPNYFTEGTPTWDDYGMGCDPETGKINIWMETWDRIMYAELATLGLIQKSDVDKMNQFYPRWNADGTRGEIYNYDAAADGVTYQEFCRGLDYSEYYNHHGVSLGAESGFMSAGWHAANYNINTLSSLVTMAGNCDAEGVNNYAVDIWGPAHEIGHQFQDVFNIRGGTEVTNNVFSNAAVWYQGGQTSRYNWGGLDSALSSFNSGLPFIDYNIWSMTQMFYKLWLYYHLAGNNTQFYPRFFEMLRVDPLNAKGATATGTDSMLKIYEKMCDAAGEDLTEFFRAHGFFVLLDNYPKGDYGTTIFTQTQEEVDAAIARVKAKYDKENYAVLLINDLTTEILCHDGVNKRKRFDGTPASEYGTVDNFINGNETAANGGTYTATYNSDGTVTMEGEGGIGFLIFDETGKLVSFSYNSTFALSDEAMETIMTGNATIVSVGTDVDAEPVTATIDLSAMQKEILGTLIAKAQLIIDKIDNTYTKIGFYKGAAVADLAEVLAYAKEVYAGSSGYEAAYDLLYAELKKVEANPDAKIPFDPSLTYIITNYAYPSRTMTLVDGVVYANTNVDVSADAAKWQFKETSATGVYNVYNCGGTYCGTISGSTAVATTTEQASASNYTIDNLGNGLWAISLNPSGTNTQFHAAANDSYKVVGWDTSGDATKWYLTAVAPNATIADLTDLEVYITKTEALLGEVLGDVTYTRGENITLQTTTEGSAGYIWSNAPCPTEGSIANLVDGAANNYFHTAWEDVTVSSGDHYIAVDLGEDNTLSRFSFSHTTRSGADNDFPKSADVYGSDDNVTYKYLGSASGMPQTRGTAWQYEGVMVASHRYLRFNMHANRGYWHMAEFDIMPVTGFTATVNDTYSDTVTVAAVTDAMEALLDGKSVAFSMSPTTDGIDDALATLKDKYEALYNLYTATIDARKETLAQLADDTDELILKAGTVTLATETPFELTTSNLYCNEVRADDCGDGGDTSANGYVANLTDNNTATFLHTNYNNNATAVNPPHYLRVDFGDGSTVTKFKFSYTTRDNGNNCPTTIVIEGCDTEDGEYDEIKTLTTANRLPNGSALEFNSSVIPMDKAYRYVRFKVTGVEGGDATFFVMSEFSLTTVTSATADVLEVYEDYISDDMLLSSRLVTNSSSAMSTNDLVTSVPLLDAQIADQQAVKSALEEAMAKVIAGKTELQELYDKTFALYEKMADADGEVADYYTTSTLTNEVLGNAKTRLDAALEVIKSYTVTEDDVQAEIELLQPVFDELDAIEQADLTADERSEIGDIAELVDSMQSLLDAAVTVTDAESPVALQADDEDAPFYIWCNAPASDSQGVAGLLDKNDDGTAITNTFLGTEWGKGTGSVADYEHYIVVDLGNVALNKFAFDYATRHDGWQKSAEFPNAIKVLICDTEDGEFEQIALFDSGLPTEAGQSWTSSLIELPKYCRYIRFAVKTTAGWFNMSDFNMKSAEMFAPTEYYSTSSLAAKQMYTMCNALKAAVEARDKYATEATYTAAFSTLTAQYGELKAIADGDVADRTELEDLRGETIELLEGVSTVGETETPVAMQCTNEHAPYYLYCNAEGKLNSWDTDRGGVAALLDVTENDEPDLTTFLHTSYGNIAQDDDLDHYLRLDMGENEALVSFKFNYVGRVGNTANAPKTILIEGSNDCETFEEITTLTGLTTANNATYQSDVISNGKAYRYIRFMVKETDNNEKNNGHPFFALSSFAVTACKTIAVNESTESNITLNLTSGVVADAYNEVYDSGNVLEHYVVQDNYNTAVNELQAAYDAVKLSMLPVVLTTDASNPVLYKIRINRDALKVLGIDDTDAKVPVEDFVRDDDTQSWYFMQGTNSESYDDIQIFPYLYNGAANTTLRLGAASADNAAGAVTAVEGTDATNTIQNWYITRASGTEEGWWNIQPEGKANYFSNNGGVANKMGFWNSAGDNGSEFQFLLDCPYTDLSIIFGASVARQPEYNAPGYYADAADYNAVYDIASGYVTNANGTDEQYTVALDNLIDAETALSGGRRVPSDALEDGAVYRIMNLITNTAAGYEYHYIQNSSATIAFPTTPAVDDNSCLWVCKANSDGTYEFVSALGTLSLGWKEGSENAQAFTIADGVADGAKCMKNSANVRMALTNEKYGSLAFNHASNGEVQDPNWSTDWYFDKIDDADVKFNVNISSRRFSSLYLPYSVEIPEGVGAFTAVAVDGTAVELVRVADKLDSSRHGTVIPARTPVILYIEDIDATPAGRFEFAYTTEEAGLPSDVEANVDIAIIHGCILRTPIQCDVAYRYYILGGKSGDTVSKMYWMYEEYSSDGTIADGNAGTDNGGYISCTANKIYMKVAETLAANSFSMRFGLDSGTTGVDEVNADSGEERVIYDLQGRKLSEITDPGIYIVNGKKIHVK